MNIVIAPQALTELHNATAFYVQKANLELSRKFLSEFERVIALISANPQIGAIFRNTRRRFILRRFPYSIIY